MAFHETSDPVEIRPGLSWCSGRTVPGENVTVLVTGDESLLKGLLKYRHPCLLQYHGHKKDGKLAIAVENCEPLSEVLISKLHPVLKIAGLWTVLQSVEFLHKRASVSLASLSLEDIFVVKSGKWKLLVSVRAQSDAKTQSEDRSKFIALVAETLRSHYHACPDAEDFVSTFSSQPDASFEQMREHPMFADNVYVNLLESLQVLPMKSTEEKDNFFRGLSRDLHSLPEEAWSQELLGLLCSRLVFIDSTARKWLLPHLLTPRTESIDKSEWSEETVNPLVPSATFKRLAVPLLETAFKVKDVSVRMALLENLHRYLSAFPESILKSRILPEILCGVRDVSDMIVSMSLKSLSLLVPVLGASAVVGPNREKIFTDGRPKGEVLPIKNLPEPFPRRSSPDGGEVPSNDVPIQDLDNSCQSPDWTSWDKGDESFDPLPTARSPSPTPKSSPLKISAAHKTPTSSSLSSSPVRKPVQPSPVRKIEDIPLDALDIKTAEWKSGKKTEVDDLFAELEPKYEAKIGLPLDEVVEKRVDEVKGKLAMAVMDGDGEPGWGQEEDGEGWDWDDEER